jgi:Mce-associated membrane protein
MTVDTQRDTAAPEEIDTESTTDDDVHEEHDADRPKAVEPNSPQRQALILVLVVLAMLVGVAGWLGHRVHQGHRLSQDHAALLQAGRQGALNLTTIDWHNADADAQRILDSATGTFHEEFSMRLQPFIDVVRQAQSTSVGTVTVAGLESATANAATVLVAVNVKVSNSAGPEQNPRSWRMRISVQKVDQEVKVSHVEFVP